ncbi:putative sulfite reductase-associated electron transfer protein DsrM [Desulfacinum infernum DSM 9756]|uniref:Putative sulfite reductase-associated electron transfer protein DsrM n=1 Tax=Desulfacinum infernum DSM 9756 TaxID=1121391 RepID=A0A1M4W7U5_9BACT|nr:sulfate reduction electron transfer complex DsrMKJOP subunit DsrM [Desulfacinum infernum]SHE77220.1 putative sulfite reductase-associated electron transfer protein DsrM [Desulfacinum infernum DSM 9756]
MNASRSIIFSLVAVGILVCLPLIGVAAGMTSFFGVIVPYLAVALFFIGVVARVVRWARSPVPFRIPTTCGQQKSFNWIKPDKLDNPWDNKGVVLRMILEVLLFRSLFRNSRMEFYEGPKIRYASAKWLWLGAIVFHYSFLVVLLRHLRFFSEPVSSLVHLLEGVDGFLEVGAPRLYISGLALLAGVAFLFLRRVTIPQLKYISLPSDYFPLFLIFAIAATGVLMRYIYKVDIVSVKELTMGLATFHPVVPEGIGSLFYIHLFLVSVLFAYFPFSKLVHMAGVFLSPTRNLPNNSRMVRHINPWNYPVKVHTYEEYEDEFREKMIEAGLPVEKKE